MQITQCPNCAAELDCITFAVLRQLSKVAGSISVIRPVALSPYRAGLEAIVHNLSNRKLMLSPTYRGNHPCHRKDATSSAGGYSYVEQAMRAWSMSAAVLGSAGVLAPHFLFVGPLKH